MPEDVPSNIAATILNLVHGEKEKVSEEDLKALQEYLDSRGTSLRATMHRLGIFSSDAYQRILRMLRPLKDTMVKERIEKSEERAMASAAVSRAKSIGRLKYEVADRIVAEHYSTALELGYPETAEGLAMFFKDAVNFYLNNLNIKEEYEDLKALTKCLINLIKPQIARLIAMKLIRSVAVEALKLAAEGKPVSADELDEVVAWAYKRMASLIGPSEVVENVGGAA